MAIGPMKSGVISTIVGDANNDGWIDSAALGPNTTIKTHHNNGNNMPKGADAFKEAIVCLGNPNPADTNGDWIPDSLNPGHGDGPISVHASNDSL